MKLEKSGNIAKNALPLACFVCIDNDIINNDIISLIDMSN